MSFAGKTRVIVQKLEIAIAVILFFTMLITCGLYINIKMNGKSATLPPLSDADKRMLQRSVAAESIEYEDDLIEPVFIGLKRQNEMLCVKPDDNARRLAESEVYDAVKKLFSGNSSKKEFSSLQEFYDFIDDIKQSEEYILVTFFCDLPSSLFLPCMLNSYDSIDYSSFFDVRYIFILPDEDGCVTGVAVSGKNVVTEMNVSDFVSFNKIMDAAYDVIDGQAKFKFNEYPPVSPVLTSSFSTEKYVITSSFEEIGKDIDSPLVDDLFELFSINKNLVKSFSSGDSSEINYVEQTRELVINDDGKVVFKSDENEGVYLDEYLGFYASNKKNYTFADKIFALKCLINSLKTNSDISFSVIGLDYDESDSLLKVYFKYMIDGCLLTDSNYDAVFEISGNMLNYAEFSMFDCVKTGETSVLFPQNYANALLTHEQGYISVDDVFCPILTPDENNHGVWKVKWSKMSFSAEVNE